jgi:hypothetical protein
MTSRPHSHSFAHAHSLDQAHIFILPWAHLHPLAHAHSLTHTVSLPCVHTCRYEADGLTNDGWFYIIDPVRSTPSYKPAKYVNCRLISAANATTPLIVETWGYHRFLSNAVGITAAAEDCATQMGVDANLASFREQGQYEAIVSEMQAFAPQANNPNFRYWIGLQHNDSMPWNPSPPSELVRCNTFQARFFSFSCSTLALCGVLCTRLLRSSYFNIAPTSLTAAPEPLDKAKGLFVLGYCSHSSHHLA